MLVNAISSFQNIYTRKNTSQNQQITRPIMANKADEVCFTGWPNKKIMRNQMRILLSQDIWAPKLSVKMPETEMEKEVLLEILHNREKLDRYTQLSNDTFTLNKKAIELKELTETDPSNSNIQVLKAELAKYDDVETTLNEMTAEIEKEIEKNRYSYDYFKSLEKLEQEYWQKRYIRSSRAEAFFNQIKENNINADGQYTTKQLIKIIKNAEPTVSTK